MKIAIDTQTILGQRSGFGFYVKNLVEGLKAVDYEDEFVLISPETELDLSTPQRFIWDQYIFPGQAKKNKVDILHQPCFSVPIFYHGKKVVTAHDIIPYIFPKFLPLASRLYFSKWMTFSYKYADHIITDSESTKKDLIKYLKLPENKISVIYLAASKEFYPRRSEEITRIKSKYQITKKYFINVGTIEPRKNLLFLVEVFSLAVKLGIQENMIIVGKKGWYYDELFTLVKKLNLQERVIFTGYVPDEDIPILYSGATALTFTSIYEGFGLPVLEAMACGTPIISSDSSSLPEVVGDAGVLLSVKDKKTWVENMVKISQNVELTQQLSRKSIEQAKKFSWEKCAQETSQVYKQVYNS